MLSVLLVAGGGALGAVARFGTVNVAQLLCGPRFPYGTLLVNCLGAFLIGFIMSFLIERSGEYAEAWRLFLVVGFLGGYTTFSSYAWESLVLFNAGDRLGGIFNILANNIGTLLLVLMGLHVSRLLGGMYAG